MSAPDGFDRPPVIGEAESKVILSDENMSRLLAVIRPHLHPDRHKLVYVFPASGRFAHMAMEPHVLSVLYGGRYDEILMVINRRSTLPVHEGLFRVASRHVRFVETDEPQVVQIGHFDGATTDCGSFTMLMQRAESLQRDYYKHLRQAGAVPYLTLPDDLAAEGDALFRRLGIAPGEPVVTVHLRERGYLQTHPYHYFRTASLDNYRPAIDRLAAAGCRVFRLGDAASTPLDHPDPRVIDLPRLPGYANWMDVVLLARARFALCCSSGPEGVARTFGTPTLVVNGYAQEGDPRNPGDVMLFKQYRDAAAGRRLSLREVLARGVDRFVTADEYEAAQIQLEENSAAEIDDAVQEMLRRRDGRFAGNGADARFNTVWREHEAARLAVWAADPLRKATAEPWYGYSLPWIGYSNAFDAANPGFLA